jgi:hypothetical protein
VRDLVGRDADCGKHLRACFDHHRRAAEIVFDCLGTSVTAQVVLQENFMDQPNVTRPLVARQWRGESKVEGEVMVFVVEFLKIVLVEDLLPGTCAVPEADFAGGRSLSRRCER